MYTEQYNQLNRQRVDWQTEEEVRLGWLTILQNTLAITFHAERGRSDADYNQVIIEFKNVGLFHGNQNSAKFQEALEELSRYIPAKAGIEGLDVRHYQGIAIDGESIAFVHISSENGQPIPGPIMPLSPDSVQMVFEACRQSCRRAVTATNLIEDFGHGSVAGGNLMQALATALMLYLDDPNNNKVKMLYQEWKALYGQVADLSSFQVEAIINSIGFTCTSTSTDKLSRILFVIHTFDFRAFEQQLRSRSTYRTRMPSAPYYAVYNVGGYTFAPWKVVWPEQPGNSGLPVAVVNTRTLQGVGEKIVVPDHKIYFAEFDDETTALYLCGLLTCSLVQKFIASFHIMIQVGDIFKHMRLPEFDERNHQHMHLVELVREAHNENDADVRNNLLTQISDIGNSIIETWTPTE